MGYDDICRFIDQNSEGRRKYSIFITPGDILATYLDEISTRDIKEHFKELDHVIYPIIWYMENSPYHLPTIEVKKGPIICNITYIENQEHSIAFDSTC